MDWVDLIFEASGIVQGVIALLLLTSVVSWAVIFLKWREFRDAERDGADFLLVYQRGAWGETHKAARAFSASPHAAMFTALSEQLARESAPTDARTEQARAQCVGWAAANALQRLETRLAFLATTGSAAPFIGLFGTVVGIINAFTGIGASGQASLAVVAPGIAEALIATAIGLLAAIPATVFYNLFVARLRGQAARAERFEGLLLGDAPALADA